MLFNVPQMRTPTLGSPSKRARRERDEYIKRKRKFRSEAHKPSMKAIPKVFEDERTHNDMGDAIIVTHDRGVDASQLTDQFITELVISFYRLEAVPDKVYPNTVLAQDYRIPVPSLLKDKVFLTMHDVEYPVIRNLQEIVLEILASCRGKKLNKQESLAIEALGKYLEMEV